METSLVLCKQGVAGSIPVTSTNYFFSITGLAAALCLCDGAPNYVPTHCTEHGIV